MRKFSSVLAPIARWVMLVALAVGTGPGPLAALPAQAAAPAAPVEQAAAGSTTLRLSVVSARTVTAAEVTPPAGTGPNGRVAINAGAAVSAPYRWIINQDNTGDPFQPRFPDCSPYYESATTPGQPDFSRPNPNYPASCNWPSIRGQQAYAPIVAQGTEAMLNTTAGVAGLPDGRYLISVSADGFKLDGAHFLVRNGLIYPSEATPTALNDAYAAPAPNGLITVAVQPLPLPTSTLRAKLFRDTSIVNGMFDSPAEDGNGLIGWRGHLADVLGEVTTDVFGNPLCTEYYTDVAASDAAGVAAVRAVFPAYVPGGTGRVLFDADGAPAIRTVGGGCFSDANGDLVIPNMGPGRYAYSVTPPADQVGRWIQTSTLEGNHDYDTWVLEGSTGFDTEFVNQAEPFPWTIFGFVERTGQMAQMPGAPASERIPTTGSASFTGEVRGVVAKTQVYVPMTGGLPYLGNLWGGFSGAKVEHPIAGAWVALTDLQAGDQAVYVGQADENGAFRIRGVRDGDYTLTYWDEPQTTLLDLTQVTIINGQVVDAGTLMVAGWFAGFSGHVFLDTNENGRMDPGEAGLDNLVLSVKRRSNSLVDRGAVQVTTTGGGHWFAENTYPFGSWIVIELYSDLYRNTGYTFQAGNQPEETIITPGAVDVSILPIIGQTGRLDIGVAPYKPGENGGIAGSVSYGTTRNELDPRHLAVENWQPGIPGLTVNLWAPVACGTNAGTPCDATRTYELAADGSYARGALLNSAVTEQWTRPTNCVVRDVSGNPTTHQWVLPTDPNAECLEGPLTGIQFGQEQQTLDGNFGFGTMFVPAYGAPGATEETLPAGDYIVEVVIPTTTVTLNTGAGLTQVVQPVYTPTREEDINVFSGSSYVPQQLPPSCVGPLHTVDVAGIAPDGPNAVENPTFVAEGGSPFEGQARPLCTMKLVTVQNQRSVAPLFELFTPVAIPARWFGYIVDDLNVSTDPATLFYGEKAGVKHSPVGLYDFANRLSYTVYSDPNGVYEPLMPSTETINCPSPSGVCTGMYRHVGNDPGQPGRLNPHYDPQFRTISANFELFPGDIIISDLAPTQIGVSIQSPGSQQHAAVQCRVADTTPQIMAVSPRPYVYGTAASGNRDLTIVGQGFGTVQGTGRVTLSTNANAAGSSVTILQWTANRIRIRVPSVTNGAYHLQVQNDLGQVSTNGVTVHVLGTAYQPRVFEVNSPGAPPGYAGAWGGNFGTIQAALNAARAYDTALVVVYPGTPSLF
ncbi:MAG: IPT/TIG domain-containing protein, partial [Anaerolineales bacterium]|nr:IPT/TIG domain-containing protein [Anaerolineales bacterium]